MGRGGVGLLLPLLVGLGACAPGGEPPAAGTSPPPPPSPSPGLSTVPPPTLQPTGPPKRPSDQFREVTATGRVERDQAGCLALVTPTVRWVLLGPAAAGLQPGAEATVVGVASPNAAVPCDGEPLRVLRVLRVDG